MSEVESEENETVLIFFQAYDSVTTMTFDFPEVGSALTTPTTTPTLSTIPTPTPSPV